MVIKLLRLKYGHVYMVRMLKKLYQLTSWFYKCNRAKKL